MKLLLVSLLLMFSTLSLAQEPLIDTVRTLEEIVISGKRLERFSAGLQVKSLERRDYGNFPGILLSDLLVSRSIHFIKSYGGSGLATISMRGTATQHTGIYWNGFNINPPNIGMADLSLLPVFLFNRIDLVSGGSSALFGNGTIGGSIHLNSQNGFKGNNLKLALSIGSYKDRLVALKSDYKLLKAQLSSSVWYNSAANDFVYVNHAKFGRPKERLENADATHIGFLQEFHLPLNSRQYINAGFWYQQREAGIPPSMTMLSSVARQSDKILRGYAQWSHETTKIHYTLKSAYSHDFLEYTDKAIGLKSEIGVGAWTNDGEVMFKVSPKTQLTSGISFQQFRAEVEAYQSIVTPYQFSVFMLATHEFPELKWTTTAGARKEYNSDFTDVPPALSLGWKGRLSKSLEGRINLSTNYRMPTLNDRYWQPGGNPDLKAESGFNMEAGINFGFEKEKTRLAMSATFYNNRVNNWIAWLPGSYNYWSPENITTVFIYGSEANIHFTYNANKFRHEAGLNWAAAKSIYGAKSFSESKGKPQLIYTPVHTASAYYTATSGNWSFQYLHKLVGTRFTDRANTNQLPAFHTIDISLARKTDLSKHVLTINASIKNLTGHAYQVIEYRPMPGRTFNVSLILDFIFKDKLTTETILQ
ncbi:MAG: TonB-dependent receptor [Bacteroidales bacterium]|nr:TonB-dependent receptor [Bacteroidales bacterium]